MAPENEPTSAENTPANAEQLRAQLVEYLVREGAIRSPEMERAFADIPRELFLPADLPLNRVYTDDAIVVKWDAHHQPTSSSSQPFLMADMLEALQVAPGMRVLEVGAGVGYNAAVLTHLLGDGALLTSVELDPEMAATARANLDRLADLLGDSYRRVTIITGDGSLGYAANAPYDRIIVTVQQWEIAPRWIEQLKVGGTLLLPLTLSTHVWGGLIPAFQKGEDGILRSVGGSHGSFMPMRGELAHPLSEATSLVRLPVEPVQLWPEFSEPNPAVGAAHLLVALPSPDLPLGQFLKNNRHTQIVPNGDYTLELTGLPADAERERPGPQAAYSVFQVFQGFHLLLAVLQQEQVFNLVLAAPQVEGETTDQNGRSNSTSKDGWVNQPRGFVLIEPVGPGYDLALLTLINAGTGRLRRLTGWRLLPSDVTGPAQPNRAVEKVLAAWQSWQQLGQPGLYQYRPLAFPADQPQPEPGLVIPRRFYNFLLPMNF